MHNVLGRTYDVARERRGIAVSNHAEDVGMALQRFGEGKVFSCGDAVDVRYRNEGIARGVCDADRITLQRYEPASLELV